jgi:hypothetical protein
LNAYLHVRKRRRFSDVCFIQEFCAEKGFENGELVSNIGDIPRSCI